MAMRVTASAFSDEEQLSRIDALLDGPIVLRELDRRRAERAGLLAPRDREMALSLTERAVLATLDEDDRLATADERLAAVARELRFEVVALPGSPRFH